MGQRSVVWQKLMSLPAADAKLYIKEQQCLGFFDSSAVAGGCDKGVSEAGDFVASLFANHCASRALGYGGGGKEFAAVVGKNITTMRRAKKRNERESVGTYF